jgi:hypothetical protein
MIDHQTPAKQWTDTEIEGMYQKLLATAADKNRDAKIPTKWNPSEFQVASGYAIRVAQNSTLPEFSQFIRTGQPVHPVKMTPAEMELLQGGSRATDWITAVGSVAVAAGAAFCA